MLQTTCIQQFGLFACQKKKKKSHLLYSLQSDNFLWFLIWKLQPNSSGAVWLRWDFWSSNKSFSFLTDKMMITLAPLVARLSDLGCSDVLLGDRTGSARSYPRSPPDGTSSECRRPHNEPYDLPEGGPDKKRISSLSGLKSLLFSLIVQRRWHHLNHARRMWVRTRVQAMPWLEMVPSGLLPFITLQNLRWKSDRLDSGIRDKLMQTTGMKITQRFNSLINICECMFVVFRSSLINLLY